MMRLITKNFGWKLLSLVAAFGVWLNIASDPELATIISVPVAYRNYPRDLVISSESAGVISLEARGPARQIRNLTDSHAAAVIDLARVNGPGERTFSLTAAELALPRGVELVRAVPAQLRFTFERKATRTLSIEVPFSGALPAGLSIEQQQMNPRELNVSGPESHVLDARSLIADPFDLTRVSGDMEQTLSVYSADPEVRILGAPQVRVKIQVKQGR